jgi:transposase-like protein
VIQALEELEYSFETMKPGAPREKAVCPVCGAKYKWRPRGVGWGVLGGENTCSYKCQKEAVRRMEEEQKTKTEGGFIKVSAFEGHLDEIKARIAAGDTMAEIARDYDRNGATLSEWLSIQVGDLVLDDLKAQGQAARKAGKNLSVSSADSSPERRAKGKRLVFEPVETEENPEATVYRADQVPPELGYVPECSVVCAESTEAAWRALGVIEGICSAALMEEHLPQVLKQLEIIAEALR